MTMLIRLLCVVFVLAGLESLAQETAAPAIQGSASAGKGVPTMQEVEATGAGATEDEAFKQAVVDAVRQVVGTLVSAENVINNDRVIKDEVLTLSDGFVEKVLSQAKVKLDDGTWQAKLKCIVRKGQLFGKLQKANVPTIKFDGVSMFADVVSQSNFRGDANKILAKAVREFFRGYPSMYKYECEKPKIVHAGDQTTKVEIAFRCMVDEERYYETLLPPLRDALKHAAKEVITMPPCDYARVYNAAHENHRPTMGEVIVQERSGWSVYLIENEILKGCDPRDIFSRQTGFGNTSAALLLFQSSDNSTTHYIAETRSNIDYLGDCVLAKLSKSSDTIEAELPTRLLPSIAKISMRLGLDVRDFIRPVNSVKQPYSGFFDDYPNEPFCSKGWLVYGVYGGSLALTRGLSDKIEYGSVLSSSGLLYYLGSSLE